MQLKEKFALTLGGIGIFILDLGFNGSSASDLFFPPQLRNVVPVPLKNATLPPSPSPPPGLGSYLPRNGNLYLDLIGASILAVGMLILVYSNRNLPKEHAIRRASSPNAH